MREMFCNAPCGSNTPLPLVNPACFFCEGEIPVPVPPNAPEPATAVFGSPPPTQVLRNGDFIAGTGISAAHAAVGTDGALALFMAPFIAGVTGSEAQPTVPGEGAYTIALEAGQDLAIAFGAALLSGAHIKITDYYDVAMFIENGGNSTTLFLAEGNTPTGYVWKDETESYVITDSEGGTMNVQNVTRLSFLVDAGLLPASVLEPGVTVIQMRAGLAGEANTIAVAIGVTTTAV